MFHGCYNRVKVLLQKMRRRVFTAAAHFFSGISLTIPVYKSIMEASINVHCSPGFW